MRIPSQRRGKSDTKDPQGVNIDDIHTGMSRRRIDMGTVDKHFFTLRRIESQASIVDLIRNIGEGDIARVITNVLNEGEVISVLNGKNRTLVVRKAN